jgi:hypothetical protein
MNTTVPNSNPTAGRKKRSKLRAIDQGTPYDATGRMVKWMRELRAGTLGRCTDIVMVARVINQEDGTGSGGPAYEYFSNGLSDSSTHKAMAEAIATRYKTR